MGGMDLSEDDKQLIEHLRASWGSQESDTQLNSRLREDLRAYAKKAGFPFTQDSVGNIYILRPGLDSSLSSIGLSFCLDSKLNPESFESALRTFLHLKSTKTTSDVILLGFSSPLKSSIGQDVWEGVENGSELYGKFPELEQFSDNVAPEEIAICALLEIGERPKGPVVVSGSPLLADQARATINTKVDVVGGGPQSSRCATARIQGKGAIEVATAVVAAYGQYVKKLFDNFD